MIEVNQEDLDKKLSVSKNNIVYPETIGIDLGIKHLAVLSTGEKIENPKALNKLLYKVKYLNRQLSRKQFGSNNRHKAKMKLVKVHLKIANQRHDVLHKLTTDLTRKYSSIVIEDLNVKGMLKNHKLSRSITDVGFYEFKRQLKYKAALRGNKIVLADRFYPSSKLCSICFVKNETLTLKDREWICNCGTKHDRDMNAANNLANYMKYQKNKESNTTCS